MSQKTIDALQQVLADSYVLYIKSHNFHWNVTGSEFHELHHLFEEQYTDLAVAVDSIAERIRTLGAKVPAGLKAFSCTKIAEGNENASAKEMLQVLAADQDVVLQALKAALTPAQNEGDEATADLLISRIAKHEKNSWMLRSSVN